MEVSDREKEVKMIKEDKVGGYLLKKVKEQHLYFCAATVRVLVKWLQHLDATSGLATTLTLC